MKPLSSISLLLFSCVIAFGQDSPKPATSSAPVPQQFRVLSQPGAPLRVAGKVTWATPEDRHAVQVYITAEGVSDRAVLAYATRREMNPPKGGAACLTDNLMPGQVLRVGQKIGRSTWQSVFSFDPPPAIWLDYAELSDGTRWGPDECHFGEMLDARRTGARIQREQLLAILKEQGAEVLLKFIQENYHKAISEEAWQKGQRPKLPIPPPVGHSREWESSFSSGAGTIIGRVLSTYETWGVWGTEIEHALRLPIDASEVKIT